MTYHNYESSPTRPIPRDEAAEVAIISSMIFDAEATSICVERLKPEDFYRLDYRLVFTSICELHYASIPVDLITLRNKLEEQEAFDKIGGADALAVIASSVSTSVNVGSYIKIVAAKSTQRRLIAACEEISHSSYTGAKNIDEILDDAEAAIFGISQRRGSAELAHISDVLLTSIDGIEKIYKNGGQIPGVPTGFSDLDNITTGLHRSDFILIAARPSMGKTAMALNITANASIRHSVPTAIFSLEMSAVQLANRLIASEGRIESNKLRTGRLDPNDWASIAEVLGPISQAPIYIDDTPGISYPQIRSKCRKLKLDKGLGLIMIDYMQLMSGSKAKSESRQQEISEISRSLKALAREMDCPVVALSQLNRAAETRSDRRPVLSDLRESGAIEQDADLVCLIYRDEYYNPNTEKKGIAEVIVAKQRNGATGCVELQYQGSCVRFANLERQMSIADDEIGQMQWA